MSSPSPKWGVGRPSRIARRRWEVLVGNPALVHNGIIFDASPRGSEKLKALVTSALPVKGMLEGPLLKATAVWVNAHKSELASLGAAVVSDLHGPILAFEGENSYTPGYSLLHDSTFFYVKRESPHGRDTHPLRVFPVRRDRDNVDPVLAASLRDYLASRATWSVDKWWRLCIGQWGLDAVAGPLYVAATRRLWGPHPSLSAATAAWSEIRKLMAIAERKCRIAVSMNDPRGMEMLAERDVLQALGNMLQIAQGVPVAKGVDSEERLTGYIRDLRHKSEVLARQESHLSDAFQLVAGFLETKDYWQVKRILEKGPVLPDYAPPRLLLRMKQLHIVGDALNRQLRRGNRATTDARIFLSLKHGLKSSERAVPLVRNIVSEMGHSHAFLAEEVPVPLMPIRSKESALIQLSDAMVLLVPPELKDDKKFGEVIFELQEAMKWQTPIVVLWGRAKKKITEFKAKHHIEGEFIPWNFNDPLVLENKLGPALSTHLSGRPR